MFTGLAIAGGAALGAGASIYAADKQSKAAGNAAAATQGQYEQSRADLSPYRGTGVLANDRLQYLLGIGSPNVGQNVAGKTEQEIRQSLIDDWQRQSPGVPVNQQAIEDAVQLNLQRQQQYNQSQNPSSAYGSLTKQFTGADLASEPGYQFEQSEGQKAIDRAAAAAGRYDSGATLKALTRFGNDYAGTKYNEAFNRDAANKGQVYGMLSGQQSTGANAAGMTANLGANATNAANNYLTGGADASAAGLVGASNALSGGVGNYLQYQNNQSTLDYLKGLRNSGTGANGGWGGNARTL